MKVIACIVLIFLGRIGAFAQADSLDMKIGQMIAVGFPGPAVDTLLLGDIRQGKVGTLVLFEKNIPVANSYVNLKRIIWSYQKAAPVPLFIAMDQEGGRVNRLKEKYGFPATRSAAALARAGSLDSVSFYAGITAATLAGLGINVNLAPVVDLASNPDNPVIARAERAFSADADSVVQYAEAFIAEHRKLGIITVLKHFPGHGSSTGDTHLGLTDVTKTWNEDELDPYRSLINAGYAGGVMTAHIVNGKLDEKDLPGTLSDAMINGLLRNKLHFTGVVFSDDMQMQAIAKYYGLEESIRLAITAGVDILMFSNNAGPADQRIAVKVQEIIRELVDHGEITVDRIDDSYRRIMTLKASLADSPH